MVVKKTDNHVRDRFFFATEAKKNGTENPKAKRKDEKKISQ